jgi:hypothetical protein
VTQPDPQPLRGLLARGTLDVELTALLWLLLDARTPIVAVGRDAAGRDAVIDALSGLLPVGVRVAHVAPDDDFDWLPEAVELGWRREGRSTTAATNRTVSPSDGVLVARGLADPDGVTGARARIVVRALALGYGLLATMTGAALDDALGALHDPEIGTDPDERSRLGVVLVVADFGGVPRVTAAHYVRPVALDSHGHVQRPAPAVLATWNPAAERWDHFAWGVLDDLAGRTGTRPIELERDQARRAAALATASAEAV